MWIECYAFIDGNRKTLDLKFSNHKVLQCKQLPLEDIRYKFLFAHQESMREEKGGKKVGEVEYEASTTTIHSVYFNKLYFINGNNRNIIQNETNARDIMPRTVEELLMLLGITNGPLRFHLNEKSNLELMDIYLFPQSINRAAESYFKGCETIEDICQMRDFILL